MLVSTLEWYSWFWTLDSYPDTFKGLIRSTNGKPEHSDFPLPFWVEWKYLLLPSVRSWWKKKASTLFGTCIVLGTVDKKALIWLICCMDRPGGGFACYGFEIMGQGFCYCCAAGIGGNFGKIIKKRTF